MSAIAPASSNVNLGLVLNKAESLVTETYGQVKKHAEYVKKHDKDFTCATLGVLAIFLAVNHWAALGSSFVATAVKPAKVTELQTKIISVWQSSEIGKVTICLMLFSAMNADSGLCAAILCGAYAGSLVMKQEPIANPQAQKYIQKEIMPLAQKETKSWLFNR